MSKIGVIFCAWQSEDLLPMSLNPWVEARRAKLGGHEFVIAGVSVPFEGFPQDGVIDDTTETLLAYRVGGQIDHLVSNITGGVDSDKKWKETEARGDALKWLVEQGVELTVMVDSDEMWDQEQIVAALTFIEANPFIVWFRVCYKQMVFTHGQWLSEPFTPPRIHRVHGHGGYRAVGFWDDNNMLYRRPWEPQAYGSVRDIEQSNMTIPQNTLWIPHETWLSNDRSRRKVLYQNGGRLWECSFRWDETKGLQFNEAYYAKRGLPLPEVSHD